MTQPAFLSKPEADRPQVAAERRCLRCGRMFRSWGAGNRICRACQTNHPDGRPLDM